MSALWSRVVAVIRAFMGVIGGAVAALGRRIGLIKASAQRSVAPAEGGRWDPVFTLPNVAIHTHLLPDATVLFWGRRDDPSGSMNDHFCTPYIWDPATGSATPTPQPRRADGTTVNLFCAGHTYLPDGQLLVAGGHITDGDGIDYAGTYDHRTNTWAPLPDMNGGRWYPTATTLADGRVLVLSGSAAAHGTIAVNAVPEIIDVISDGDDTPWQPTVDFVGLPLYPRMHVAPDGRVLMAGSNAMTYLLDTRGGGTWTPLAARAGGSREYGSSVMYAPGKVLYVGGGNDAGSDLPTASAEVIDLTDPTPTWRPVASMHNRRRQHNATALPDGTVLVTGGTSGPGFNDLSRGKPVHTAELWDPDTDRWTSLNAEDVDRCYHATTVVLPDATVLSAGGGEFMTGSTPNAPADTHRNAQIFHPPYLFRGPRPVITTAPSELTPGGTFTVEATGADVASIALLRLASVTHAFDMNQRRIPVPFTAGGTTLTATLPAEPGVCLPGHYMLFVLSAAGVPSVAKIVRIGLSSQPHTLAETPSAGAPARLLAPDEPAPGTRVTVGLTAQCPYGLAACWGGAYEALTALTGVVVVTPYADAADSTAEVFLGTNGLPDLDDWPDELARSANGSYAFRGIELTVDGTVERRGDEVVLLSAYRPPIRLHPLEPGEELAWDLTERRPRPATDEERAAYTRLADRIGHTVQVTGPATKSGADWSLAVREVRNA